jgi:ATP-dependent DNA ligase
VPSNKRKTFTALTPLLVDACPYANLPEKKGPGRIDREKMRAVTLVRPAVLAEIAFNEETSVGRLRHAKFLRLRKDVDARPSGA